MRLAEARHKYRSIPFFDLAEERCPLGEVNQEFAALIVLHDIKHPPLVQAILEGEGVSPTMNLMQHRKTGKMYPIPSGEMSQGNVLRRLDLLAQVGSESLLVHGR